MAPNPNVARAFARAVIEPPIDPGDPPPNIDATGATEVSGLLNAYMLALPIGSTMTLAENGLYLCNKTVIVPDRQLTINFNGARTISNVSSPSQFTMTDGAITLESGVYHLRSASNPFGPLRTTPFAWYVTGTGIFGLCRTGSAQYIDDGHVTLYQIPSTPPNVGTNKTIKVTSPTDRNRMHWLIKNCFHVHLIDPAISGANALYGAFAPLLEGQAGIEIDSSRDVTIDRPLIDKCWGDGIRISKNGAQLPYYTITGGHIDHVARHGLNPNAATKYPDGSSSILEIPQINDCKRHLIDIEPNAANSTVEWLKMRNMQLDRGGTGLLAISAYLGVHVLVRHIEFTDIDANVPIFGGQIPIGNNLTPANPRWGPILIARMTIAQQFGTGSAGATDWESLPAVVKARYVDGFEVADSELKTQAGRGMWGVWARQCTGVNVHGNTGYEAGRQLKTD